MLALLGCAAGTGRAAEAAAPPLRDAAVERLEAQARRIAPDAFAGAWLQGGRLVVAYTGDAEVRARRVRDALPGSRPVEAVTLPRRLRDLELIQARMIVDREYAKHGRPAVPGLPGAAHDLDLDVTRNVVVARVAPGLGGTAEAIARGYGEAVEVVEAPLDQPDACSRIDCPALRGGVWTRIPKPEGGFGYCSTAFPVRHRGGKTGILSAGHCPGEAGAARYHGKPGAEKFYGSVRAEHVGQELDAEWHSVNKPFTAANACIFRNASGDCAWGSRTSVFGHIQFPHLRFAVNVLTTSLLKSGGPP